MSNEPYFSFRRLKKDDPALDKVYRLRYKVYCEEWGFERPEDLERDENGGLERDQYDPHSVHFVAERRSDGEVIGTIRIIRFSALGFPLEKHFDLFPECGERLMSIERERAGEISRLAVSKEYRRRDVDKAIFEDGDVKPLTSSELFSERRKLENNIVLGLYRCIDRECDNLGITSLFAVMARGLHMLLARIGIPFSQIGTERDYHGLRAPYLGNVAEMRTELQSRNRRFFDSYIGL